MLWVTVKRYLQCAWVSFLSGTEIGLRIAIWKLNDKIICSGIMNGCAHARPRPSPQLRFRRRHRRLHQRRRARSPDAIDGEPTDQAARGEPRLSPASPEWEAGDADRGRR